MARSIDQAPQDSYDNQNNFNAPQVHPEHVPKSLGGSTPVHEDWKPQSIDKKPSSKNKLIATLAGVSIATAGIFGLSGVFKAKNDIENIKDQLSGNISNSAEPFPDQANDSSPLISESSESSQVYSKAEIQSLDPVDNRDVFEQIDVKYLVNAYASNFDEWRESTYEIMGRHMSSSQAGVVEMPSSQDKYSYTDQDVLNTVTIDIADASIQQDPKEGQRMLPLVMNRNCSGFDDFFNKTPEDNVLIHATKQVGENLPRPVNEFMGHDLTDTAQARVIKWENAPGPHEESSNNYQRYGLYALYESNGNSAWQLIEKWDPADYNITKAIETLTS